eukprot:gene6855-9388_t
MKSYDLILLSIQGVVLVTLSCLQLIPLINVSDTKIISIGALNVVKYQQLYDLRIVNFYFGVVLFFDVINKSFLSYLTVQSKFEDIILCQFVVAASHCVVGYRYLVSRNNIYVLDILLLQLAQSLSYYAMIMKFSSMLTATTNITEKHHIFTKWWLQTITIILFTVFQLFLTLNQTIKSFSPEVSLVLYAITVICCVLSIIYLMGLVYSLTNGFNRVLNYETSSLVLLFLAFNVVKLASTIENPSQISFLRINLLLLLIFNLASIFLPRMVPRIQLLNLQDEIEHKKTFVSYISHEIRSPLSTTNLGLDYLIEQLRSRKVEMCAEEVIDVLLDSKQACDLATKTINELLMFDKIESRMLEIEPVETKAFLFLMHCIKPFKIQARASNIDLIFEESTCLNLQEMHHCASYIDKHKMEQVVRNFLSNAIKFTPSGGTITVNIDYQQNFSTHSNIIDNIKENDGVVRLEVIDNGPGLTKENLMKLFGQYVQFNASELQGGKGSGLGLWLSKAIVEMHGGYIGASSEGVNKGSTFFFELPCSKIKNQRRSSIRLSILSKKYANISVLPSEDHSSSHINQTESDKTKVSNEQAAGKLAQYSTRLRKKSLLINQPELNRKASLTARVMLDGSGKSNHTIDQLGRINSKRIDRSGRRKRSLNSIKTVRQYYYLYPHQDGTNSEQPSDSNIITSNNDGSGKIIEENNNLLSNNLDLISSSIDWQLKLLIVDDSKMSRKMVERSLSSMTRLCHHAGNGQEALGLIWDSIQQDEPYDLVLIDFYMPDINGAEVIHKARSFSFEGIILGVTGSTNAEDYGLMLESGSDAIVIKPLQLNKIRDLIKRLLSDDDVQLYQEEGLITEVNL